MRVLVAPDKFRGTLSATQAARAIAIGWRRSRPTDQVEVVPLADGGDGSLDVLVDALGGQRRVCRVDGPLGEPVEAEFGVVQRQSGPMAIVEMSRASGLHLVREDRHDVRRATSRGTGQLLLASAREAGNVLVCIGGSATNDGGAGMAQALGARLTDVNGVELEPGGAALLRLAKIDVSKLDPVARSASYAAACDVDNPLTGPQGASRTYGPQKGASVGDIELLDRALAHFEDVIGRDLGVEIRDVPGGGAGGGLGAGLAAFLGASLRPGVEIVMDAVAFRDRVAGADLVVTGEGKLDEQSLHGKVPAGVLRCARKLDKETVILCGRAEIRLEGVRVASLVHAFGELRALNEPSRALEDLAEMVALP